MPPNGWGCKCRVRQISRREAERRRGVTARPPYDPVEWTNKHTGETQKLDRGLDPALAGNPGVDRARILQDSLAEKIDLADEGLARAALRQVVDSPLLERHLARVKGALPKGDLRIGRAIGIREEGVRKKKREISDRGRSSSIPRFYGLAWMSGGKRVATAGRATDRRLPDDP